MITALKHRTVIHDIPDHWTREQKIEQLLTIASMLASRCNSYDRGLVTMDAADIYQTAAVAITKAVDDYNPDRGAKLTTWALNQAKLAVRDALRRNSHASRTMQERGQHIRWVSFNQPTADGSGDQISLEEIISETVHADSIDIIDILHRDWQRTQLRAYLSRLSDREQKVMLGYLQEKPIAAIAEDLNVCDSRIYQIIEEAIRKMQNFEKFEITKTKVNCYREEQKSSFTLN